MHNEIRVSKGKCKCHVKEDSNTKDQNFHCLDQGENRSHFYFEKTPKKLWVKKRTSKVLPVDRIKLNMFKFWLSEFDLFENMFSYTLVINQFKLRL